MECDPATRQRLVYLDKSRELGSKFIITDLDETHVLIEPDKVDSLVQKLESIMESLNKSCVLPCYKNYVLG
ncbi:hypothetical protein L596_021437 [Steinernema carpocapsae]|uniref:General transcription and DNA repair factor IIH subunit TFB5 n=1 Tax=Steinernema carpocapsae TaxID=34508 RepID=A0A4U5MIQ9_STECR|nr:hypothetical protein L596_021437 [Steinernema carpocapsae]